MEAPAYEYRRRVMERNLHAMTSKRSTASRRPPTARAGQSARGLEVNDDAIPTAGGVTGVPPRTHRGRTPRRWCAKEPVADQPGPKGRPSLTAVKTAARHADFERRKSHTTSPMPGLRYAPVTSAPTGPRTTRLGPSAGHPGDRTKIATSSEWPWPVLPSTPITVRAFRSE